MSLTFSAWAHIFVSLYSALKESLMASRPEARRSPLTLLCHSCDRPLEDKTQRRCVSGKKVGQGNYYTVTGTQMSPHNNTSDIMSAAVHFCNLLRFAATAGPKHKFTIVSDFRETQQQFEKMTLEKHAPKSALMRFRLSGDTCRSGLTLACWFNPLILNSSLHQWL